MRGVASLIFKNPIVAFYHGGLLPVLHGVTIKPPVNGFKKWVNACKCGYNYHTYNGYDPIYNW